MKKNILRVIFLLTLLCAGGAVGDRALAQTSGPAGLALPENSADAQDMLSNVKARIPGAFDSAKKDLTENASPAWQRMFDAVRAFWAEKVQPILQSVWDAIVTRLREEFGPRIEPFKQKLNEATKQMEESAAHQAAEQGKNLLPLKK